jgi:hypothetical protein
MTTTNHLGLTLVEQSQAQKEITVPLAVVIALLLQMAGALIWSVQLDARVNNLEEGTVSSKGLSEKFARLEERLDNLKEMTADLKRQIDQLTERLLK